MHGAICLNKQCEEPVTIPWKENCQVVRIPTTKSEGNGISTDSQNGEEGTISLNTKDVIENGEDKDTVHCKECGTKYTDKHVDVFVKTMEFTHVHLQNMERASVACILFK